MLTIPPIVPPTLVKKSNLNSEIRHGEKKNYDASLPIHKDVLPHIFSILITLNLPLPEKIKRIHWNEKKTEIKFMILKL